MNLLSSTATWLALLSPGRRWTSAPEPSLSLPAPQLPDHRHGPCPVLAAPPSPPAGLASAPEELSEHGQRPGKQGRLCRISDRRAAEQIWKTGEEGGMQKHPMFLHLRQEKNDSAFQKQTQQNKGGNDEASLGQTELERLEGCLADSSSSRCSSAGR